MNEAAIHAKVEAEDERARRVYLEQIDHYVSRLSAMVAGARGRCLPLDELCEVRDAVKEAFACVESRC